VARAQNISDQEIGAILAIVMAVAAGKINVMMRELTTTSQD
jgi:hypothetical protein